MFKQYISILMLLLPAVVWASPPDWEVSDPTSYDYTALAVVQLVLDGQLSDNPADRVAFVVDGEVRGVGQAINLGVSVYHFVTLYSDVVVGEEMEILVYQAATDLVFAAETSISFQYQNIYGNVNDPLLVNAFFDGDATVSLGAVDSLTTLQGVPFAAVDLSDALVQMDNDSIVWSADPDPHLQATFTGSQLQVAVIDPDWFGSTTLTVRVTEVTANAYSASTGVVFTVEERGAAPQWTPIPRQENPPGSTFPLLDLDDYEIAYDGVCLDYGIGPVLETPDPVLSAPNWSVSTANADFTTNIIATAHYTPAFPFDEPGDLLSFWIDGELLGMISPQVYGGQVFYIGNVTSSAPEGEMEVRMYSSQMQDVYTLPVTLPFGVNGSLGSINEPLVLDFSPFQFAIDENGRLQTSTQEPDYVGAGRYELSAADCAYPEALNDQVATDFCQDVDTDGDGWCDTLDPAPLDPCVPDSDPRPLNVQYSGAALTSGDTLQVATDSSFCERVLDWRVFSIEDCAAVAVEASLSVSSMGGQGTAELQLLDTVTGRYRLLLTLPQGESVLTVTNNVASFQQTIDVRDQEAPVALCSDVTVYLDETGAGSLAADALAAGNSTDNCGAPTETSPATSFTCADAPNATVVLTATDAAGNSSTASCTVNIDGLTIKGAPTVCHQLDWTYSVDAPTATAYAWTLPFGWTGSSTTSSITVTPQPSSSGIVKCIATTPCGNITLTLNVSAKDDCDTGLDFDGTDDYVDMPDGVYFDGDFTIESWVYPAIHNSHARLLDFGNGEADDNVYLSLSDGTTGQPKLVIYDGATESSLIAPVDLPLGKWSHLAATLSGTSATIYIDGEEVASGTISVPNNITRTSCYVGRSNWAADGYTDGKIDELRIWNVARTQQEIQDHLFCQITVPPPSLQVYLPFENGQLAGTNTGTAITQDFSGNGNDGTLQNFALTGNSSNFEADPDITRYLDGDADGYGDLSMSATDFCLGGSYVMVAGDCDDTNEEIHPHANDKCGNSIDDNCNGITDETRLVLEFDDDVDHDVVNFGNTLGNFGTGDFTVEVRFKTTDPYAALLVKRGICGNDNFWSLHIDNGLPYFDMGENTGGLHYGGMNGTVSVNDGEWHHIAVTRSGTGLRMYVDGQIVGFGKSAADISNMYDLKIGDTPCTSNDPLQLNGEIDEVSIWSVARNYHELSAFANASLSGTEAGLTAYHDFNNPNAMGSGTNTSQTISEDRTANGYDGTLVDFALDGSTSNWLEQQALLNLSAFLEGPYKTSTGLMNDNLRANNLLPLGEPYTDLNYTYTGHSGGQTIPQSVLDVTGNDAIVDWIVLEVRDKDEPATVKYSEPVLLQRDGNVVDLDGVSNVEVCEVFYDDYFVVVRHRSHLGAMTGATHYVKGSKSAALDMSDGSISIWGSGALKELATDVWGLWAGDANMNGQVQNTDIENYWKLTVGEAGYKAADFNMNGQVQNTDIELIWKLNVGKGEQVPE